MESIRSREWNLITMAANNIGIYMAGDSNLTGNPNNGVWNEELNEFTSEINALNDYCKTNVNIEGTKATSVRSVKIEDINRLHPSKVPTEYTGYNGEVLLPTGQTATGIVNNSNQYYEYPITEATGLLCDSSGYWLASSFVRASSSGVYFGLRMNYNNRVFMGSLWDSEINGYSTFDMGVRPVVCISADALLTSNGTNSWTIS